VEKSLCDSKCRVCEGGVSPFDVRTVDAYLKKIDANWQVNEVKTQITRVFEFKGFAKTMQFVNAIAWIANQEMHHPDLEVSFNRCVVRLSTHAIQGLSENDFVMAAKIDALLA